MRRSRAHEDAIEHVRDIAAASMGPHAFLRDFGQPPQVIRRNARVEAVG
jgi:hypothetical protein